MTSYSSTAIIIQKRACMPSCGCVIFKKEVLLVKRASKPFKGYWALPGGRKEENETFEDCLHREVAEETGLCVSDLKTFSVIHVKNRYGSQLSQVYIATPCSFDIKRQVGEVSAVEYFPIDELPSHIVPFHKKVIEDYKENKK